MTEENTAHANVTVEAFAQAALFVLTFSAAYGCAGAFASASALAPTWIVTVALVVAMMRSRLHWLALLTGSLGMVAGSLLAGASPSCVASAVIAVAVEASVASGILSRRIGARREILSITDLVAISSASISAAAIASIVYGAIILTTGQSWFAATTNWFATHTLGMLFLTPLVFTVDRTTYGKPAWSRNGVECLLIVLLSTMATVVVFDQSPYPILFLLFPVLTFAAFRLMFNGIGLVIGCVAIVATVATWHGNGPIAHNLPSPAERLIFLQFLLAVVTLSILPLASILTDRVGLLSTLGTSERLYRLLADHSSDMIVRIGLDGKRRFVSPASVRILEFTPEEMIGETPIAAIHIEDRARVERVCRSLLDGADDPICVYRQRRKDGSYATLEATYRLVRDDDGQPVEFIASVRDIGRRQAAELSATQTAAQLEENNRLLSMAETIAGVGHWRLDAMTQDLFWSPVVYAIHGLDPKDRQQLVAGLDAYHPDDRAVVEQHVSRALKDGIAWHHHARIIRPDGSIRHVSAQGQAERAPDDSIVGLFGVFQDVTERVEAEAALIAARDEAQASTAAKSAFLATMSHEIRTPMTGVLGMIELLRTDPDAPNRNRFFDGLEQSATLLMTVLDDILDFSKIESRNLILEAVDFDLGELAQRTIDLFHQAASRKGLLLALDCPLEAEPLRGDPTRLQQVISNLISNAIKFTLDGRIDLKLTITADGRRPRVRCEVTDTGIGIDEDKTALLFEPFVQADASTTRRFGGTGLGLAITRRLVEAMHGTIGVDSDVGAGSTFWFEITLDRARGDRLAVPKRPVEAGRPLSVLLAEDNHINQALISALVRRDGHAVTCVENGRLAVDAALAQRFDVILMDMQMPQMDGLTATRLIRAGGGPCSNVPIIALTADASIERRRHYDGAGLTEFLTKPVDSELLSSTLAAAGQNRSVASSATPLRAGVSVLDEDKLAKLETAIGRSQVNMLLQMLSDDMRTRPTVIEELVAMRNLDAAAAEAHALKGAALGIGAQHLGEAARALETLEALDDPDLAARALSDAARSTLLAIDARAKRQRP